jgi:DNA-binding winged helix-turn-helix (wHTH) protein
MRSDFQRGNDPSSKKRLRRYLVDSSPTVTPTFNCGFAQFNLTLRVAFVNGRSVGIRPQEARLLSILFRNAGNVVDYDELTSSLYGERIAREACRSRLKSLTADVRRRFGAEMQAALRTAPGRGLVLQLSNTKFRARLGGCTRVRRLVCLRPGDVAAPTATACSNARQRNCQHIEGC